MTRKEFLNRNKNIISKLYNGIHTIYGPYIAKDNRRRVILYDGNRRITRQYAKLKMEIKLGRRISYNETVDHIDRNKLNDSYTNLQILDRKNHCSVDAFKAKVVSEHKCQWCSENLQLTKSQRNSKKAGPFCSRKCSGKYGAALQGRKINKLNRQKIIVEYIR